MFDHGLGDLGEERRREAKHPPVPRRPAQDQAQDVAAAFIAGQHAVANQEGDRSAVIRDDAVGYPAGSALGVAQRGIELVSAQQLLRAGDDRGEEVGVVGCRHALQDGHHALEPHARVDVLGRQRHQTIILGVVVLNEDEVPKLNIALAVAVDATDMPGHALLVARLRPPIDVDLAARPARPGVAHLPEVVFAAAEDDVAGIDVGLGAPVARRLFVAPQIALIILENGGPQALLRQMPHVRQQLPGPRDGFLLVIVAKGPIPQHLEEGMMYWRPADVIQIVVLAAHAHALLRIGHAPRLRLAQGQEDLLELIHAGIGEQQRGIAQRHQRSAGHDRVALAGKEIKELLAHFGAGRDAFVGHQDILHSTRDVRRRTATLDRPPHSVRQSARAGNPDA